MWNGRNRAHRYHAESALFSSLNAVDRLASRRRRSSFSDVLLGKLPNTGDSFQTLSFRFPFTLTSTAVAIETIRCGLFGVDLHCGFKETPWRPSSNQS